eukprot:TRINITY_DN1_c0_g2_i1.p1 TRINITY_DN1_c0_g2~~TRINITY_DN1_c0_g2_i1.p1  ORF type:complete len:1416 (+),score=462.56 TRINITY_DN1_c0_g2_i1:470-4249(+)
MEIHNRCGCHFGVACLEHHASPRTINTNASSIEAQAEVESVIMEESATTGVSVEEIGEGLGVRVDANLEGPDQIPRSHSFQDMGIWQGASSSVPKFFNVSPNSNSHHAVSISPVQSSRPMTPLAPQHVTGWARDEQLQLSPGPPIKASEMSPRPTSPGFLKLTSTLPSSPPQQQPSLSSPPGSPQGLVEFSFDGIDDVSTMKDRIETITTPPMNGGINGEMSSLMASLADGSKRLNDPQLNTTIPIKQHSSSILNGPSIWVPDGTPSNRRAPTPKITTNNSRKPPTQRSATSHNSLVSSGTFMPFMVKRPTTSTVDMPSVVKNALYKPKPREPMSKSDWIPSSQRKKIEAKKRKRSRKLSIANNLVVRNPPPELEVKNEENGDDNDMEISGVISVASSPTTHRPWTPPSAAHSNILPIAPELSLPSAISEDPEPTYQTSTLSTLSETTDTQMDQSIITETTKPPTLTEEPSVVEIEIEKEEEEEIKEEKPPTPPVEKKQKPPAIEVKNPNSSVTSSKRISPKRKISPKRVPRKQPSPKKPTPKKAPVRRKPISKPVRKKPQGKPPIARKKPIARRASIKPPPPSSSSESSYDDTSSSDEGNSNVDRLLASLARSEVTTPVNQGRRASVQSIFDFDADLLEKHNSDPTARSRNSKGSMDENIPGSEQQQTDRRKSSVGTDRTGTGRGRLNSAENASSARSRFMIAKKAKQTQLLKENKLQASDLPDFSSDEDPNDYMTMGSLSDFSDSEFDMLSMAHSEHGSGDRPFTAKSSGRPRSAASSRLKESLRGLKSRRFARDGDDNLVSIQRRHIARQNRAIVLQGRHMKFSQEVSFKPMLLRQLGSRHKSNKAMSDSDEEVEEETSESARQKSMSTVSHAAPLPEANVDLDWISKHLKDKMATWKNFFDNQFMKLFPPSLDNEDDLNPTKSIQEYKQRRAKASLEYLPHLKTEKNRTNERRRTFAGNEMTIVKLIDGKGETAVLGARNWLYGTFWIEQPSEPVDVMAKVTEGDVSIFISDTSIPTVGNHRWRSSGLSMTPKVTVRPADHGIAAGTSLYVGVYANTESHFSLVCSAKSKIDQFGQTNYRTVDKLMGKFRAFARNKEMESAGVVSPLPLSAMAMSMMGSPLMSPTSVDFDSERRPLSRQGLPPIQPTPTSVDETPLMSKDTDYSARSEIPEPDSPLTSRSKTSHHSYLEGICTEGLDLTKLGKKYPIRRQRTTQPMYTSPKLTEKEFLTTTDDKGLTLKIPQLKPSRSLPVLWKK